MSLIGTAKHGIGASARPQPKQSDVNVAIPHLRGKYCQVTRMVRMLDSVFTTGLTFLRSLPSDGGVHLTVMASEDRRLRLITAALTRVSPRIRSSCPCRSKAFGTGYKEAPRARLQALWTDRAIALHARSKAAVVIRRNAVLRTQQGDSRSTFRMARSRSDAYWPHPLVPLFSMRCYPAFAIREPVRLFSFQHLLRLTHSVFAVLMASPFRPCGGLYP